MIQEIEADFYKFRIVARHSRYLEDDRREREKDFSSSQRLYKYSKSKTRYVCLNSFSVVMNRESHHQSASVVPYKFSLTQRIVTPMGINDLDKQAIGNKQKAMTEEKPCFWYNMKSHFPKCPIIMTFELIFSKTHFEVIMRLSNRPVNGGVMCLLQHLEFLIFAQVQRCAPKILASVLFLGIAMEQIFVVLDTLRCILIIS